MDTEREWLNPMCIPTLCNFTPTFQQEEETLRKAKAKVCPDKHYHQIPSPGAGVPRPSWGAAQELHIWAQVSSKAAACAQETQKHLITDRKIKLIILQSEDQVCAVFIKGLMSPSSSYAKPRWLIHRAFVQVSLQFTFGKLQSLLTQFCFLLLGSGWVAYSQETLHSYEYLIPLGIHMQSVHGYIHVHSHHRWECAYTAATQREPKLWASETAIIGTQAMHRKIQFFFWW